MSIVSSPFQQHLRGSLVGLALVSMLTAAVSSTRVTAQQSVPTPPGGLQQLPINPYSDPEQSMSDLELIVPGSLWEMTVSPTGGIPIQIVAGQLSADALTDLVLFDGSVIDTVHGVEVFGNTLHPSIQTRGLTSYQIAGSLRTRLVRSHDAGLSWSVAHGNGEFERHAAGSAIWIGAHSLAAGHLDSNDSTDVAGVTPIGEVCVLHDIEDGSVNETVFAPSAPALDIALVNWDNQGAQEIVVQTANDLLIYSADGIYLASTAIFGTTGALSTMHAINTDWVVWVGKGPALLNEYVVCFNASSPFYIYPTGTLGADAVACGDLNGDDVPEIAIRYGADGKVLLLAYTGSGFDSSDPDYAQSFDGFAGDGANSQPLFHDIDGDGDNELLWACAGGSKIRIIRSSSIDETVQAPRIADAAYDYDTPNVVNYLRLTLDNPDPAEFTLPSTWTHLQAVVYRKATVNAETVTLNPFATLSTEISFDLPPPSPAGPQPLQPMSFPINPRGGDIVYGATPQRDNFIYHGDSPLVTPYDPWIIQVAEDDPEFEGTAAIYAVVLRYCEMETLANGDLNTIVAGPPQVLLFGTETFAHQGTGGSYDYLSAIGNLNGASYITSEPPPGPIQAELHAVGTIVPTKPIPDVEEDFKPDLDEKEDSD